MGEYLPPATPATCGAVTDDVVVEALADVPVAYDRDLGIDVCLEVNLSDPSVDLDAVTALTRDGDTLRRNT